MSLISLFLKFINLQGNVHVETEEGLKVCKLIAVHAGLEKGKDVEEQIKFLKGRVARVPKLEALSGRKNVWDLPQVIDDLLPMPNKWSTSFLLYLILKLFSQTYRASG